MAPNLTPDSSTTQKTTHTPEQAMREAREALMVYAHKPKDGQTYAAWLGFVAKDEGKAAEEAIAALDAALAGHERYPRRGPLEAVGAEVFGPDGYRIADTAIPHIHREHDGNKGHWNYEDGSALDMPESEEHAYASLFAACVNALRGHDPDTVAAKLERHERLVGALEGAGVDGHAFAKLSGKSTGHSLEFYDCAHGVCRQRRALLDEAREVQG